MGVRGFPPNLPQTSVIMLGLSNTSWAGNPGANNLGVGLTDASQATIGW